MSRSHTLPQHPWERLQRLVVYSLLPLPLLLPTHPTQSDLEARARLLRWSFGGLEGSRDIFEPRLELAKNYLEVISSFSLYFGKNV